ncbi:mitochondrial ribosomal protein L21 precursor, putative [Plasmodium gaboni]|uniref:Large ribosomal subunit protein bL21m n=1 Tax=Plasmodium gaboni TaxID=647221 RepID=A0ABY1UTN0_9APIC|nr:mitochondrial ribosomal protein L21 precursor, putative [Plasmodium gaboni]
MMGKHRKRKINPPVIPIHPNEEKKKNLNNFITYKDLKIRWRNTSKNYRKKVTIARKWKNLHCLLPMNKSSCMFVLHNNLPYTRLTKKNYIPQEKNEIILKKSYDETKDESDKYCEDINNNNNNSNNNSNNIKYVYNNINKCDYNNEAHICNTSLGRRKFYNWTKKKEERKNLNNNPSCNMNEENYYEKPPKNLEYLLKKDKDHLFCIFKSNITNEHKVTIGDIIQTERLHRKKAGDVIYFGTVLFVGSPNFSIIGKPTISYCKVKAVIEQITLSKEILSFRYKKVRRSSRFLRIKHWISILKIQDIIIELNQNTINDERKKPLQIIDLWANRWLYQKELNFMKFDDNKKPLADRIFNLIEHQPNTLHRRGLTECYRFYPDPHVPVTY